MTQRERILGGLLGASVIGALAYQGVNTLAVQPYLKLSSDITRLRDEKAQLETNIAKRPVLQAEWATCTLHTLAPDEQVAQTRLRVSVQQLLAHAGFVGFELRKPSVVDHPLFRKAGFREVELNINKAEGGLDNLVKLLHALYECGYNPDLRRLAISAERTGGRSAGRNVAAAPATVKLKFEMLVTTLVLPKVLDIAPRQYDPNAGPVSPSRMRFTLDEYTRIVDGNNVFVKYVAPVIRPPEPNEPIKVPDPNEGRQPIVVLRPERTLIATVAINGHLLARVRKDDDEGALPDEFTELGTDVDDGMLVLIHREGIVVRSTNPEGATVDWFYSLGKSFKEREVLSAQTHPAVYQAVQAQDPLPAPAEVPAADEPGASDARHPPPPPVRPAPGPATLTSSKPARGHGSR